ncbi:MAG: hypothetical protein NTY15_13785 [Planctomycetota bacterium]|nr:hypothetical protein [Planctomycetota bacterium]
MNGAPIPGEYVIQRAYPGFDTAVPLQMPVNQDGSFRMLAPKTDPSAFCAREERFWKSTQNHLGV